MHPGVHRRILRPMVTRFSILFVMLLSIVALPGCPVITSACQKTLPVLSLGQTYSQDATNALDQVQVLVNNTPLSADKKKIVQDAIDKARLALRTASTIMTSAAEACSAPNVLEAFKDFNVIWSMIKGLIGSNVGAGLIGVAPGSPTGISDPAVYRKAGGK